MAQLNHDVMISLIW